ncbi:TonB-dependent siderophore receptor [Pseudorhodoferax sp. Leaf265]|uniref:TonB-dependent receptor n=1 Tax=Pseudorhodoferax sp. Leaf265 TaxID=1736315 RepID=UPI0007C74183|nr:TonB-dependent siderophore receptor [Pseudorhodoferax sp. Leaf265]
MTHTKHLRATAQQPDASNPILPLGALAAGFGLMVASCAVGAQTTATGASLPQVNVKATAEENSKENLQTNRTTIGKGQQEIRDIPQSITVMTERLIDDAKLETLKQALHYTAGITFAATENGTDQDIRMRGFPVATTGDLLIDGMKDPSQYDRDSFNYDRIEVMRGSASMLFGRGSTGGVINQVTKQPKLITEQEVVTTVGTGGSIRVTGDFNAIVGENAALRVNVMKQKASNFGAEIDKEGIAPTYRWGIGTADEFSVGLFYLNTDNVPMSSLRYLSGSVAKDISARNFYGTDSDYLRGEATYGAASWKHRFAGGGGELRTQMRSGVFHRASWGTTAGYCGVALTATGTCPAGTPAVTAATLTDQTAMTRSGLAPRKDKIRGTYVQSDYSNSFQWLGMKHEILTGVDAARESADRFVAVTGTGLVGTNFNKGGTSVGTPNDGTRTAVDPVYRPGSDYSGHSYGAYIQDVVNLTPQWKLLGGLRYDNFKADMNTISAAAVKTSSDLSYSSLWSSRFGVLFQPSATQSYHISYGTSFNTSADTYQYTDQRTADVPAEKSRNIEIGGKLDWLDGQLSTRAAIFRTEKYNERTTDSDFAGNFPVLSGKRHSQGVEFDVVGRITPALEVYLSYAWTHEAKIDKVGTAVAAGIVGSPVGLTPKHSGATWISYQLMPKLRVAGGARGAARNRPLQGTTGAASTTASAPGYIAYDAMVEYQFTDNVYAQLNVSNLTNKVYGDQLYPGFYTPGEARTAKFTLGVKF